MWTRFHISGPVNVVRIAIDNLEEAVRACPSLTDMDQRDANDPKTRPLVSRPVGPSYERLGRVRLKILRGPEEGRVFEIAVSHERTIRGGRNKTNDVVLQDDLVSAFHFSLHFGPGGIVLRDIDSTNGVFVQGVQVREAVLDLKAEFRVGDTTLQIVGTDTVSVRLSEKDHFDEMYGWSPVMRELFADLERIAAVPSSTLPVLITGETGTGKELVARGLANRSCRAKKPFIVLDATSIPHDLADSVLSGYARGAFTGANTDHAGVFEQADGGTLFIDELGELPRELQGKLLRVLERGEISRINEQKRVRRVDVRVISATNRDLRRMVAEGTFREDLLFRLLGKHIELPNLHERGDDTILLAERFLAELCTRIGLAPKHFTAAAREALRAAPWPGNVRQLRKVVECAIHDTDGSVIDRGDLHLDLGITLHRGKRDFDPLLLMRWPDAQEAFQREYLKALIQRSGREHGWITRAAAFAGMERSGFVRALKRHGLYGPGMDVDT